MLVYLCRHTFAYVLFVGPVAAAGAGYAHIVGRGDGYYEVDILVKSTFVEYG